MKITCPVCDAKYSITDEKVQDRLAKIRCRKCGTTIVIDGKVSPPNVYAADAPAPAADEAPAAGGEYTVDFGENDQRNLSKAEVLEGLRGGTITPDTYVWAEGFEDWKLVRDVPELAQAQAPTKAAGSAAPVAAAVVPRAAAQTVANAPWGSGSAPAPADEDDENTRVASASTPKHGGDLFGGFASAGSEEEVTTSAAQHQAPAATPAASTGARNESSVLFSLAALTAAAASKPSHPPAGASSPSEDSGLIDLKALATAAQKAPAPALGVAALPIGLSPLGGVSPSPLGGQAASFANPVDTSAFTLAQQNKSRTGLFIGGAIVVAALLVAAAVVLKGGGEEATGPAAPAAAAAEVQAAAAPAAPEPPQEPAAPPATGTAEAAAPPPTGTAEAAPAPAKPATAARPSAAKKPAATASKPAAAPASEPAAAPAPKKKAGGCGCAPGDLMCAMQCAAK